MNYVGNYEVNELCGKLCMYTFIYFGGNYFSLVYPWIINFLH